MSPEEASTEAQGEAELPPSIDSIRKYAEELPVAGAAAIPAAYPFDLRIEGPLTPIERAKLLDLISRENMGFREIDLEPQFQAGRIFLPRISEYAGVLIIQALRDSPARLHLSPSESSA